ncbi:MAG: hypothetical protein F6K31_40615 [Symploca sp. SIO2G7]|nr:hypothetical protein [Symploca sp. SIO2G7]
MKSTRRCLKHWLLGGMMAAIAACQPITTHFIATDYTATANVTYTWQVRYSRADGRDRPNDTRLETFASVSLENQNGVRPGLAVTGPDEAGLWWPELPPKPTVDDMEARQQKNEQAAAPELVKSTDYTLTVDQAGQQRTLPTSYKVYRQAIKAYGNQRPLAVILGPQDESVMTVTVQ